MYRMKRKLETCDPPRWAIRILRHVGRCTDSRSFLHDMDLEFADIIAEHGIRRARRWYGVQAVCAVPELLYSFITWRISMLGNYLKVALRNLLRQKVYALLNILGLAVGIACCLFIFLFVKHELSYDRYHEYAGRIYRVTIDGEIGGSRFDSAALAAPTAPALMEDYPEVLEATRLYQVEGQLERFIKYGEQNFKEPRVIFADGNVFNVFTFSFLRGDPQTALTQPYTIVITRSMARKYFGSEDAVGKRLTMDGQTDYEVTGIIEDMPSASHFHADFLPSLVTLEDSRDPYWLNNMAFRSYILLEAGASHEALEAKFPDMVLKYIGPMLERLYGNEVREMMESGMALAYHLQPLTDIHLHSHKIQEFGPNSDLRIVNIFSVVALFILAIACVNFINLSTARSMKRAREAGIRKVVGSLRSNLIIQFLLESMCMSIAALIFAYTLVGFTMPWFNLITGKSFGWTDLTDGSGLITSLLLMLVTGLLAGLYPAVSFASFKPVTAIKRQSTRGTRGRRLRNVLVVFQFTASIILIISTLVVGRQMTYIRNRDVGFDDEQVLIVHDGYLLDNRIDAFRNEVVTMPEVLNGTLSGFLPVTSDRLLDVSLPEGKYRENGTPMQRWFVDFDYIETMGMEIIKGRNFSRTFSTDSSAIIVNEAAVRHFGWDEPIGMHVGDYTAPPERRLIDWPVIGVVKDFHYESLRSRIAPLILQLRRSTNLISFRLKTDDLKDTVEKVRRSWKTFAPDQPFAYSFMDDRFDAMYHAEQRIGHIFGAFASLAVFVGCLGLFGLAAFTAEQRTKEIGIRKVLGSTAPGIAVLMTGQFIRWVALANLIAWPVAYFVMHRWLESFAYRTQIGWTTFLLAGGLAVLIALLTVSYQALRAALADPVESLRYE